MHQLEGFVHMHVVFAALPRKGVDEFLVLDISCCRQLGIGKLSSFGLHFIVELPTIVFLVNPRMWTPFRVRLAMLYQLIPYLPVATVT